MDRARLERLQLAAEVHGLEEQVALLAMYVRDEKDTETAGELDDVVTKLNKLRIRLEGR